LKETPYLDEDYRLWVLLNLVRDACLNMRRKDLLTINTTTSQVSVLDVIEISGGKVIQGKIADRLLRKPHSVSGILKRMYKEGLIEKKKIPNGGNRTMVTITPKGEAVLQNSLGRGSFHRMMSSLSKEQKQQLKSCLTTLWESVHKEEGTKLEPFFPFV
jgi:DNA-binding MarR family transcriptional regulator